MTDGKDGWIEGGESQWSDSEKVWGVATPSGKLKLAAELLVLAGLLTIAQGCLLFLAGDNLGDAYMDELGCFSLLSLLFGVVSIMAGYGVLKRSSFTFVVIGAVVAILGVGLIVGAAFAIAALVLIFMNRSEFR